MTNDKERSLPELFSDLGQELSALLRQEIKLARTEIAGKISGLGRDVIFLLVAALIALMAVPMFLIAAVAGLATIMAVWQAALLVGGALLLIGAVLAVAGYTGLKQADPVPHRTIHTLKEGAQWAKHQWG